ncbi:MAG: MFS transporter [Steroidobacteraceae bacterium]
MLAAPLSHRFASTHLLSVTMFLVGLSFLAGYFQHCPLAWHFGWRFMPALGGGMIVVVAGLLVVSQAKPEQRPLSSQVVLLGISMGMVMAGALMPILLGNGVPATWLVLGGVTLALTAFTWFMWPPAQVTTRAGGRAGALRPVQPAVHAHGGGCLPWPGALRDCPEACVGEVNSQASDRCPVGSSRPPDHDDQEHVAARAPRGLQWAWVCQAL